MLKPHYLIVLLFTLYAVSGDDCLAQVSNKNNAVGFDFEEIKSSQQRINELLESGKLVYARNLGGARFAVLFSENDRTHQHQKFSESDWKKAQQGDWLKDVSTFTVQTLDKESLFEELRRKGVKYELIRSHEGSGSLVIHLPHIKDRQILENSNFISFIDRGNKIPLEETWVNYHDLSVNKINAAHQKSNLAGEGFSLSIKEKSFNTNDIDLRGRIFSSSLASAELSVHANFMATIAAGGGNSASNSKGVAWKARVGSSDFNNLFADDITKLTQDGVSAQNHSYGVGIENYYGAEARSYDVTIAGNPELLQVFSAGNSGLTPNTQGNYAGLGSYGTLTGNFKTAKNILVVGGHYKDYRVDERNSHGPTFDGRVKPEVVAYGEEGTSDAAAVVTGLGLVLQEAYQKKTGSMPAAALVKAVLIAGADDIETPGVDHRTGFGAVNGIRSWEIIEAGNFLASDINSNQRKLISIDVPSGLNSMKLVLTWTDPASQAGDAEALINDLDMALKDPNGIVILPWVLSSFPHLDSLSAYPKRKKDKLNNVEFISIDKPIPGTYQADISALQLIGDKQGFSLAWSFDSINNFEWTFPTSASLLAANEEVYLRWNNSFTASASIEYSEIDGPWQMLIPEVEVTKGYAVWKTPDFNGSMKLRMNFGGDQYESQPFIISRQPALKVGFNCELDAMISWDKIPEATSYQVLTVGEKYLVPITTTIDTVALINKSQSGTSFFVVTPIIKTTPAYPSNAYDINNGGVNCYYVLFNGLPEGNKANLTLTLSTLYNVKSVVFERLTANGFIPVHSFSTPALQLSFLDGPLTGGVTNYRARIDLVNGEPSITNTINIYYADETVFAIWPNPAKAGEPITIFTDGNDLTIHFYSTTGQLVEVSPLVGSLFKPTIQPNIGTGLFLYRIFRHDYPVASGKLVVIE